MVSPKRLFQGQTLITAGRTQGRHAIIQNVFLFVTIAISLFLRLLCMTGATIIMAILTNIILIGIIAGLS